MKFETRDRVFLFITVFLLGNVRCNDESLRNKKHFSLFSVVTFKNEECSSEPTFTGGSVKGTCYTATECGDKSGTKSGNCASGFGVCCIFISNTGASVTISENRTYLRNPLFPSIETTESADISYTINKMQSDICQVRLDFDTFVIAGPANTEQIGTDGATTNCNDLMKTTATSNMFVPELCGVLTGEHLYVDVGPDSTDNVVFLFQFAIVTTNVPTPANAMRLWSIKTSQIPCWAPYRAPDGCHRYFMQASGQIISPNFAKVPAGTSRAAGQLLSGMDLLSQDLKTCLRREKGMCCTKFQVCQQFGGIDLTINACCNGGAVLTFDTSIITEGWSFHSHLGEATNDLAIGSATAGGNDHGLVDAGCSVDYVEIPDSTTGVKNLGAAVVVNSRYCGARFGDVDFITAAGALTHAPVYDCTEPFEVNYHTDQMSGLGAVAAAVANDADTMRGFCLDFTQEAC